MKTQEKYLIHAKVSPMPIMLLDRNNCNKMHSSLFKTIFVIVINLALLSKGSIIFNYLSLFEAAIAFNFVFYATFIFCACPAPVPVICFCLYCEKRLYF